jgi:acyl-ACP thioesterase
MYYFDGRVRYSEVDSEQNMTLHALLDYLQDCCTFQSEDLGIGVDYLSGIHSAWVLSSWQIEIIELPRFGERIRTSTWPYEVKGFYGYRNFLIESESGEPYVRVNSLWVFMDTERMRPARVDEHVQKVYEKDYGEELTGDWGDRKIKLPAGDDIEKQWKAEPLTVERFQIDTNHHMNNSRYIQVAQTYVPQDFAVKGLRVEYRKAAKLGDMLYPVITAERDHRRITVELKDASEGIYAIIQFVC